MREAITLPKTQREEPKAKAEDAVRWLRAEGFGDGHSPVDEGEYFISEAIKEAEAALSAPGSEAVK